MNKIVEIPFGTKDSQLKGWEYTIPEGMEAVIENGKVIIREKVKENEDERMWDKILNHFDWSFKGPYLTHEECDEIKAFLVEKLGQKPAKWSEEDAKLENCWHKVADSFPDSTREVICKDAIGNFFIGRYYKGSGSWEVSMYDDSDKSNEDNPPVIMWCDIPSEKQKEQKWSEVDDAIHTRILGALGKAFVGVLPTKPSQEDIEWFKSLPERFNLQWSEEDLEEVEWSEEDLEKIGNLDEAAEEYAPDFSNSIESKAAVDAIREAFKAGAEWLRMKAHIPLPEDFAAGDEYWKPSEEQKYDGNMDKECIKLCDVLNSNQSIDTFESCCGHLKDRYSIWFFCNDIITLSRLGRCVSHNYSDGKWELLVDSTDTHPTGVFWLRSKVPFQSYDEMEKSVNELCNNIQHWFNPTFDSYFKKDLVEVKQ